MACSARLRQGLTLNQFAQTRRFAPKKEALEIRKNLTQFGHPFMSYLRASLRSDNCPNSSDHCPNWIGSGVRIDRNAHRLMRADPKLALRHPEEWDFQELMDKPELPYAVYYERRRQLWKDSASAPLLAAMRLAFPLFPGPWETGSPPARPPWSSGKERAAAIPSSPQPRRPPSSERGPPAAGRRRWFVPACNGPARARCPC